MKRNDISLMCTYHGDTNVHSVLELQQKLTLILIRTKILHFAIEKKVKIRNGKEGK